MKFIDEHGRVNGKFSIIDIIIVLGVLITILGAFLRFNGAISEKMAPSSTIEYKAKVGSIRIQSVEALQKKGMLIDRKLRETVGEIIDVQYEPTEAESVTADGSFIKTVLPERYDAIVTVRCEGKVLKNSYLSMNNVELFVGGYIDIETRDVKTSGEIIALN